MAKTRTVYQNSVAVRLVLLALFTVIATTLPTAVAQEETDGTRVPQMGWPLYTPSPVPDRVILTWREDPSTSQAVTWRTDDSVSQAYAELALEDGSPYIGEAAERFEATTSELETEDHGVSHHHAVEFNGLEPDTLYVYRVGDGAENWSEWLQFRTANVEGEPFSFIYFGDAQNDIRELWSRTIRMAYSDLPKANFMLHAGDLIDHANVDWQWGEWFGAGSWINGMIPSIPATGNHEYYREEDDGPRLLSIQWPHHFTLPEHGPEGHEEITYYIDYQGTRFIALDSMKALDDEESLQAQAEWLDEVLSDNPNRWTILTWHHPMFSVAEGRDNPVLREVWMPILEQHNVDLILQGHDHSYGRGANIPEGTMIEGTREDGSQGPVYVVSVSGPKMYDIDPGAEWMERLGADIQLYQIIHVDQDRIHYEARTVEGELYDAFELVKDDNGDKEFVDLAPDAPERRREAEETTETQ